MSTDGRGRPTTGGPEEPSRRQGTSASADAASRDAVREAALAMLARGVSVLPVNPRSKRPLLPYWEPLQRVRALPEVVNGWFDTWPWAGFGAICGPVSGGLVLADIDDKGEVSGVRTADANGLSRPETWTSRTQHGGWHFWFLAPAGVRVANAAPMAGLPGIDRRGTGGYGVMPPSAGYTWAPGLFPDDVPLAPAPAWLLAGSAPATAGRGGPRTADHWAALMVGGAAEGSRNSSVTSLAGHLLRHFVDPRVARGLTHAFNREHCHPPLPDAEIDGILSSIATRELRRQATPR